jgi:outer membrane protein assembly factor BamD (BamD/ComL family)
MQHFSLARQLQAMWLLLGILWAGHTPMSAQAQQDEATATRVYEFGLHLFQLGDYYRAITEFKRFSLLFPGYIYQPAAELLIGLALQEDRAYDDAFTHFQHWRLDDDPTDATRVAAFKLGELRFQQGQYRQAIDYFQGFLETYPDGPLVSYTRYMLGLSWALDGQLSEAQQVFATLPTRDPLAQQALALQEELRLTPPPQLKSPLVAGVLSGVLPGAGHLYAGKPLQALTAFILNGVFLGGAAYAFHEKLEATGAILLFFEAGWYLGGINSAMDAARDANRQPQKAFTDYLRATYAPPVLTFQRLQAPGLGLRLTF